MAQILGHDPQPLALPRRVFYLPPEYKKRKNTVVEGRASSGEVGPNGLVSHTEDWEGRVAAVAAPAVNRIAWSVSEQRFRPLTYQEQVDRGYIVPGSGPVGVRI